ncbi:hypothetical protein [Streptomyces sp. SAS_270]|uniref:hypothetical protein n=1 Tax=Streptomyces sp. SAS_270 TaxID=3412748 RepID=UPI00403CCE23
MSFRTGVRMERVDGEPVDPTGLHGGVGGADLSTDPAFLAPYLPLWAERWGAPVGSIEDTFVALAAGHVPEIWWNWLVWPDVPELDLDAETTHAGVSVLFNTRTRELDVRADDHTVLVHVRSLSSMEYMHRQASLAGRADREDRRRGSAAHSAARCTAMDGRRVGFYARLSDTSD